jgi:hypothetical protein
MPEQINVEVTHKRIIADSDPAVRRAHTDPTSSQAEEVAHPDPVGDSCDGASGPGSAEEARAACTAGT